MQHPLKEEALLSSISIAEKTNFDQYRLLAETVTKYNDMREQANNFWTTVNVVLISGIAYIKDAKNIDLSHKPTFMWVALVLGYALSLTWLSYLGRVKRVEEFGIEMLVQMETVMSHKVFTRLNGNMPQAGKAAVTFSELIVPILFLTGYLFFTAGLVFFKQEAITPSF